MSSPETKLTPGRVIPRHSAYKDLSINYEGRSEDIPVRLPDISAHGMFINTPRIFPEGSVLKVTFRLGRSDYQVHARAEVRYCLTGVGIGVEFFEISDQDRAAINEELALDD